MRPRSKVWFSRVPRIVAVEAREALLPVLLPNTHEIFERYRGSVEVVDVEGAGWDRAVDPSHAASPRLMDYLKRVPSDLET